MAYVAPNEIINGYPKTLGASETNTVISNVVKLENADKTNLAVLVKTTAASGTIEVDLQHSPDGTNHWTAVNTTDARLSFTSATTQRMFINPQRTNASTYLPLFPFIRVVATTAGGESITFSDVHVTYNQQ